MPLFHWTGTQTVQPIPVPPKYEALFRHLHGTPLFFMQPVLKLNSSFGKDKRIGYVTDYTLNLAHMDGTISRCYKIEDIDALLVDPSRLAVGVRMRSRPFRRSALSSAKAYFEMPVDVVLFLPDRAEADYQRLIDSLCEAHQHWTEVPLRVRELARGERFSDLLVLAPDGSRVKQPPVHMCPTSAPRSQALSHSPTARQTCDSPPPIKAREHSHAPHCHSSDDGNDETPRDVFSGQDVEDPVFRLARLHETQEQLYSTQSALDDLQRSNASFSQLEGLMWVYYDDLPAALQRELCTREELTHRACLTAQDTAVQPQHSGGGGSRTSRTSRTSRIGLSSTHVRSADAEVLGSQMDALLRELNRKQQQICSLEYELKSSSRRKVRQLDEV